MICLEASYFNLNKILLQGIALWPFQQSKFTRLQYIIIFIILVTINICQLATFVTSELTPKFVLKAVPCILYYMILLMHYVSFQIHMKTVKDLMWQLHYACTELKDTNEIAIIYKYGWNAKRYTNIFILLFFSGIFIFLASQITIAFLDTISPINGSRSYRTYVATEYFIDQEKYFFLIQFHINIATVIGTFSMIAIATLLMVYIQHTCGMFKIACYRIEHAMKIKVLKNISLNNESSIFQKIVHAINIHRKAMKLSQIFISKFDATFLCLTMLSVITLSLCLFQIFQVIISEDDGMEILISVLILVVLFIYMFFSNFFGQNITDHSNEVYDAAYNIRWYMYPRHTQRLILLLLQRKTKEFHLTCGGLFVASFECFATLVKATMSYFTFMHSVRR